MVIELAAFFGRSSEAKRRASTRDGQGRCCLPLTRVIFCGKATKKRQSPGRATAAWLYQGEGVGVPAKGWGGRPLSPALSGRWSVPLQTSPFFLFLTGQRKKERTKEKNPGSAAVMSSCSIIAFLVSIVQWYYPPPKRKKGRRPRVKARPCIYPDSDFSFTFSSVLPSKCIA